MLSVPVTRGQSSRPDAAFFAGVAARQVPLPRLRPLLAVRPAALLALALLPAAGPGGGRAAELDLAALRRYSQPLPGQETLAAAASFSDLRPTDWAWQAVRNLAERYGCGTAKGAGRFEGGLALSRFEAAALLQECLPRIGALTDELRRLLADFQPELALLRGRVEGLDARVGRLAALQFSPTTKLSGLATAVVGGNVFTGGSGGAAPQANAVAGALTFTYDLQLGLNTSFNGKDLLFLNLRGGNFADTPFGGYGLTGYLSTLDAAFQEFCTPSDCANVLAVDRLYYRWPVGGGFTAMVGPMAGQEDFLPLWPSVYPSSSVLNVFTANGAPAAWNMTQGAGGGLWWEGGGFSVAAGYIAALGDGSAPASGGIGTTGAAASSSVQIGYSNKAFNIAAIWSRLQTGVQSAGGTAFILSQELLNNATTDAFGLAGSWQPHQAGWVPSVSAGWGINSTHNDPPVAAGQLTTSQSWMVGLQWDNAFREGNALGMAVGQPLFATALSGGDAPDDGGMIFEAWYKVQLTDAISFAPAVFWLSRPLGMDTPAGGSFGQFGALVRTDVAF